MDTIFNNIINPALQLFMPEMISFNYDPTFTDPTNPSPFYYDTKIFT